MKNVDYIVVGFGLAGMAFCKYLEKHNKSFVVFDLANESASRVAAGLYNPVILKRYTLPWQGEKQFDLAMQFYNSLAAHLKRDLKVSLAVQKVFASVEDQNNWFEASDKPGLKRFLNPLLIKENKKFLSAPYYYGQVQETGRLYISKLLDRYREILTQKDAFAKEGFIHNDLHINDTHVEYKKIKANRVVFAEGYGVKRNPYFNKLPLVGNKGEYIIIHAPDLKLDVAVKSSFFVIPLGDDLYKVGATFNWEEKDFLPTSHAKKELSEKLKSKMSCDFKVVNQVAGVRPTTGDRRPLLGIHPKYKPLAILNGLGTRGVMMAPFLAQMLYAHLENGNSLDKDVDIMRFAKKFE